MKRILASLGFTPIAVAYCSIATDSSTAVPSGAPIVGGTGSYAMIQDTVNARDVAISSEQSILIDPDIYCEQVYVREVRSPLSIYGSTSDAGSCSSDEATIPGSGSEANGMRATRV